MEGVHLDWDVWHIMMWTNGDAMCWAASLNHVVVLLELDDALDWMVQAI